MTPSLVVNIASSSHRLSAADLAALRSFYEAWGHQALVAGGAVWFDGGAFSWMSIPTVLTPDVEDATVRSALAQTRKLAAIYPGPAPGGTPVPLFMLRDKSYGLGHVQRQFRQQVREASERLVTRECSWPEWAQAAQRCDRETLARRSGKPITTHPLLTSLGRERVVAAASALPHLGVHACFHGNEIVAYLVHLTLGSVCEGLMSHRCDATRESPARHAAHLLFHSFAKTAMAREPVDAVCVGRQSVPANPSLARFKRHAGFDTEVCTLQFRLHPWLAPWIENPLASRLLRMIRNGGTGTYPKLANLEVLERAGLRGVTINPPQTRSGPPPSPPE